MDKRKFKAVISHISALILIFGFILTIFSFFLFFKFHISVFSVDQLNFNRYQDIPLEFDSLTFNDRNVKWEIPLVFTVNKIHNSPLIDLETGKEIPYSKNDIQFIIDSLKKNLPDKCYEFSLNAISEASKEGCESTKKFDINYPYPVFDGNSTLITQNLIIFSPSSATVLTSVWPLFSSTSPAFFTGLG